MFPSSLAILISKLPIPTSKRKKLSPRILGSDGARVEPDKTKRFDDSEAEREKGHDWTRARRADFDCQESVQKGDQARFVQSAQCNVVEWGDRFDFAKIYSQTNLTDFNIYLFIFNYCELL